jgi:pilus assembly protein TadC
MAVNLLVPMVLFVFPAVIIVAAGPAVIKLMDILGK